MVGYPRPELTSDPALPYGIRHDHVGRLNMGRKAPAYAVGAEDRCLGCCYLRGFEDSRAKEAREQLPS